MITRCYLWLTLLLFVAFVHRGEARLRAPPAVRNLADTCRDNPNEFAVSVEIQIEFPDQEHDTVNCRGTTQDETIGATVESTLNDRFPASVPDWDGGVTFRDFQFDVAQNVGRVGIPKPPANEKPPPATNCSSSVDMTCSADYCRTGCLVVDSTNCGSSTFTNWVNLGDDIEEALSDLNFGCLGIPAILEVTIVVDLPGDSSPSLPPEAPIPTISPTTAPSSIGTLTTSPTETRETSSPTSIIGEPTSTPSGSTLSPTATPTASPSNSTPSPTETPSIGTANPTPIPTGAPSLAAAPSPTVAPSISTVNPTSIPTVAPSLTATSSPTETPPTGTANPNSIPTGAPSLTATLSPTVAPSNDTPSPTAMPTIAPSTSTTNPTALPTTAPSDRTQKPTATSTTTVIPTAPSATPAPSCTDNPQDVTVNIDLQLQFPNAEVIACSSGQERSINSNIQAALNQNFASAVPKWEGDAIFGPFLFDPNQAVTNPNRVRRRVLSKDRMLQQGTCSMRYVECEGDSCKWGCLVASTTDCGTSSFANWINLESVVQQRLASLGFKCLGIADQLEVIFLVEDPDSGSSARTSFYREHSIDSNTLVETINDSLLGHDDAADETVSDVVTKAFEVHSTLTFTFFDGKGDLPDTPSMASAIQETMDFFSSQFRASETFADAFEELQISKLHPRYDPSTDPDMFVLKYLATVLVNEDAAVNARETANVMAGAPYRSFINDYLRGHGGVFADTFRIHFRGVVKGDGHGRELVDAEGLLE